MLGENVYHGRRSLISITQADRLGHMWVLGKTGAGKSTTAWGLLHHGFSYLSDELAPIDLETLEVLPYRHALCLKRRPPSPLLAGAVKPEARIGGRGHQLR